MRKPIQKIVALCCVGAMALCFASCKPDDTNTETTTDPVTVESTEEPSSEESTAPVDNGGEDTSAPQNTNTGIAKPGSPAEAVKLYNDAIAKKGAVTATITRKLNSGTAAGLADLMELGVPAEFDQTDAAVEGADLYALDVGSVSNMNVTESGDNYVITFTLNAVNGNASMKAGDGGYMYILDYPTITGLIDKIGKKLGGESFNLEVKEDSAKLGLTNGKLTATINKTTGAISAATLDFVQNVEAKVKYGITVTAKLQGQGTVKYTVA